MGSSVCIITAAMRPQVDESVAFVPTLWYSKMFLDKPSLASWIGFRNTYIIDWGRQLERTDGQKEKERKGKRRNAKTDL